MILLCKKISYSSDGLELCWGISKIGENIYKLDYTITNFVKDYAGGGGLSYRSGGSSSGGSSGGGLR